MSDETAHRGAMANVGRTLTVSTFVAFACAALVACGASGSKVAASNPSAPGVQTTARSAPSTSTTPQVLQTEDARYGTILTDAKGYVLYSYSGDTPVGIGCSGPCLALWSPVLLPGGATTSGAGVAGLGTIVRPEGVQVTYRGRPLYTFIHDTMPGQVSGEGFGGGRWTVVVVSSGAVATSTTGSTRGPTPAAPPAAPVTTLHPTQVTPTIPPTVTQPTVTAPPPTPAPTTRPASPPTTAPGGGPSY